MEVTEKLTTCSLGLDFRIRELGGRYMSSGFLLVEKTFSTYRQFVPVEKLARTGIVIKVSGGMTILAADHTFLSVLLNLVFHLNLWFFWWIDWVDKFRTCSLKACPSSSRNRGDTELFMDILWLESPNSIKQVPSYWITKIGYWSAKSFPKINGVLMPLTT